MSVLQFVQIFFSQLCGITNSTGRRIFLIAIRADSKIRGHIRLMIGELAYDAANVVKWQPASCQFITKRTK